MGMKRRQAFIKAVAEAARNTRPPLRRGRAVLANLTVEGRARGLACSGHEGVAQVPGAS